MEFKPQSECWLLQLTLMDWGNAIVRSKTTNSAGEITSIEMDLFLEGDFKKTKKKITWLAQPSTESPLVPVTLKDYDYLITKKKLEEGDDVDNFITPVTEFIELAVADANVKDLKKGEFMQFERKGYFMFDGEGSDGRLEFIKIPDGKAAGLASKAGAPAPAPVAQSTASAPATKMYEVASVYGDNVNPDADSKMYKLDSIYKS